MTFLAFSTSFTGTSLHPPHNPRHSLTPRRPSPTQPPSAILGSRTTSSPFGAQQTKQTYTVKVLQNDRCTLVQVDRDTNLRKALLAAKIDLYTLGGKLRNCGGGGSCGTCLIALEEGQYSTNGRTPKEEVLLEGKPDNWRLACRTMVNGDCTVRTKPRQ